MTTTTTADRKIRKHIMERDGVERVTIRRDGSVEAYGTMPRGDGRQERWSRYEGTTKELLREIDAEN